MVQAGSVLSLGEVLIDLIVADGASSLEVADAFIARPGGAPANVAVALSRLGVPSAFCGAIGADPFGNRLRSVLAGDGVEIESLRSIDESSTTLAFAWKDARGDGQFRIIRLAHTLLSVEQVEAASIEQRGAIIVGSVALTDEPSRTAIYRAVSIASAAHVPIVFDVNVRPSLWASRILARQACQPVLDAATILKLSVDDADFLLDLRGPDEIFAADVGGMSIRLLTDGGRGAWFKDDHESVQHVPAFDIDPIEPTGAGDAFTAAVVMRFLAHPAPPVHDDMVFASAAGAITATRVGAIESLPTLSEIKQFLAAR